VRRTAVGEHQSVERHVAAIAAKRIEPEARPGSGRTRVFGGPVARADAPSRTWARPHYGRLAAAGWADRRARARDRPVNGAEAIVEPLMDEIAGSVRHKTEQQLAVELAENELSRLRGDESLTRGPPALVENLRYDESLSPAVTACLRASVSECW